MTTGDIDLTAGSAVIRRGKGGKGGKGRPVPFGPATGRAIDRYLRLRRSHRRYQPGRTIARLRAGARLRTSACRFANAAPCHVSSGRCPAVVRRRGAAVTI
jgi:integrase